MDSKVGLTNLSEFTAMRFQSSCRMAAAARRSAPNDLPKPAEAARGGGFSLALMVSCCAVVAGWSPVARCQSAPYNPYADSQDSRPPVAADGTLLWGTFYKSAQLQKTYERLWNLGACRGTNKAITIPVEENRLAIDTLPEESLQGVVRGVQGGLHGGLIAFVDPSAEDPAHAVKVAMLHPAGVSRVAVRGDADTAALTPGLTVRTRARVDRRGKGLEPVTRIDIVTPPAGFTPDEVHPDTPGTIVGTVVRASGNGLVLRVDAGTIRRITLPLAEDVRVTIDAAEMQLASAGDTVEIKGRVWSGKGCLAAATVFASDVTIIKPERMTASASAAAVSP
ncbi:MAG: hypothetical protein ACOYK7_11760 [Pirellulales bacterium]|jgi:hypothetical protein